jgi:hypothetical protein
MWVIYHQDQAIWWTFLQDAPVVLEAGICDKAWSRSEIQTRSLKYVNHELGLVLKATMAYSPKENGHFENKNA